MANTDPRMAETMMTTYGPKGDEEIQLAISGKDKYDNDGMPWTQDLLIQFLEEKTAKMVATARSKNHDYTGDAQDPFYNFEMANMLGVPAGTQWGFIFRMTDKFSRIISLLKVGKAKVLDEKLEDTLVDLANYCLLLAAWLRARGL